MNKSGRRLLETCYQYNLVITNTLFQHKLSHRTTWTVPFREFKTHDGSKRKNPIRNQIDYIMIKNRHRRYVQNARSYGGMQTVTDHKLVIANINLENLEIQKTYKKNIKSEPKININALTNIDNQVKYKESIDEIEINNEMTPQEKWDKIVETHKKVGQEVLGKITRNQKSTNNEIKEVAERKRKFSLDAESCQDATKRKEKIECSKEIGKKLKTLLKKEEEKRIDEDLKELEAMKNDSNKCYAAIRKFNRMTKKKPLCVKDDEGNVASSDEEKIEIITKYFKKMLAPEGAETNKEYKPTEMRNPFTEEEIRKAAKSLKNNKSTGIDDLPAELIKYAPDKTHQTIADIFNEMAKTGENPKELEIGILNPLPKPKKTKGPAENLRPIILLSIIRKILTICLIRRTWERFVKEIPTEQAAYQEGRSTTEQVFTIKMLVEKAINYSN